MAVTGRRQGPSCCRAAARGKNGDDWDSATSARSRNFVEKGQNVPGVLRIMYCSRVKVLWSIKNRVPPIDNLILFPNGFRSSIIKDA